MSSIFTAATSAASASIVYRAEGGIAGLREVADESASLSVVAFPFELLDEVARVRPLDVPGCYLLANGSAAYVGESVNVQNRLGQHQIDPAKNFATEAFVITSASGCGLDKAVALLLQQHLTAAIEAAGLVSLAIGRKPQAIGLPSWREATVERIAKDARRLLFDAGCRALDSNNPPILLQATMDLSQPPPPDPAETGDDGAMTIGVFTAPLGCEQYQLDYVGLWARGFANEQDFVVCAGSEVRIGINPSVNPILVTRRRALAEAGALEAIRGLEDRQRLTTAVAFPSAAIAAKVVTGAHVNAGAWQRLRQAPPVVMS